VVAALAALAVLVSPGRAAAQEPTAAVNGVSNYGTVIVGSVPADGFVNFTNLSPADTYDVTSVTIGGTNPSDFRFLVDFCTGQSVPPGFGSCSVRVAFAPTAVGVRRATIDFVTTAPEGTLSFAVVGVGGPISVWADDQDSDSVLDFPIGVQAPVGRTKDVEVSLRADSPINISAVTIEGVDAELFSVVSDTCSPLAIDFCRMGFRFAPTDTQFRTASAVIHSDALQSAFEIRLEGTGLPLIARWCSEVGSWDFNQVPLGSSREAELGLSNCGTIPANVSGFTLSGPHRADFAIVSDNCTGAPVQPDQGCPFTVRFTPSAAGRREATITVHSDALPIALPVLLTGEGLANTDLSVVAAALPVVPTGRDVVVLGVVTNRGPDTAPVVSLSMSVPGPFRSLTTVPAANCVSGPFASCNLGPLRSGESVLVVLRFTAVDPPGATLVSEWIVSEFDQTCGCFRSFDPDRANNISRPQVRVVGRR
jgi:hypothetical protein